MAARTFSSLGRVGYSMNKIGSNLQTCLPTTAHREQIEVYFCVFMCNGTSTAGLLYYSEKGRYLVENASDSLLGATRPLRTAVGFGQTQALLTPLMSSTLLCSMMSCRVKTSPFAWSCKMLSLTALWFISSLQDDTTTKQAILFSDYRRRASCDLCPLSLSTGQIYVRPKKIVLPRIALLSAVTSNVGLSCARCLNSR